MRLMCSRHASAQIHCNLQHLVTSTCVSLRRNRGSRAQALLPPSLPLAPQQHLISASPFESRACPHIIFNTLREPCAELKHEQRSKSCICKLKHEQRSKSCICNHVAEKTRGIFNTLHEPWTKLKHEQRSQSCICNHVAEKTRGI